VLTFAPSEGAATFDSAEGRIVVWFPVPGIAAATIHGRATGEVTKRVYELVDEQPVFPNWGFVDFEGMTGFDWEARGRALTWNIVHISPKMRFHMLVPSPPLLIATTVFRRALQGHIEVHTERASFDSAYSLAVKQRSRLAPPTIPPAR